MEHLKKLRNLPVSALMSREVVTIQGSQTVAEAIELLKKHDITSLVIVPRNEDDTFGIITEKDILEKVIDPGADVHKDPWNTQVHMVMSKPVITIGQNLAVKYAIRLMKKVGVRRLVVAKENEIQGIVSQSDILRAVEDLPGSSDVAR